jgi:hypothetical protein
MRTFADNSSTRGRNVSFICSLILLFAHSSPCSAQQSQPALQITSPANGSILNPGQILSVTVTSPAGLTLTNVMVIGEQELGLVGSGTSVPATVSATIPTTIQLGQYMLTAMGLTSAGQLVQSGTILIGVERPDFPVSLAADPSRILFQIQGQRQPLKISATFSDGSALDVTGSTNMGYSSSNTVVATVDANGSVTAVGTGGAIITARYGQGSSATVPVIVPPPVLASSPASLSFGSQNIWTSSGSQTLTITNVSQNPGLTIGAVASTGDFSETDNCVSSTPLAPSASCTISLTFMPTAGGSRTGAIKVTNSMTAGAFVIPVTGTGTAGSSAPIIMTLSPTSGVVGTSVTVSGANFGSTQGASTIAFNGTTATPTSWSAASIAASVPSGATTGDVIVVVAGQRSNGASFIVEVPPPSITSLSPTAGALGAPVTITGVNFGATQGSSKVTFNGTTAMPTGWSPASIVAPVPNGATTGNVLVTVGGQESNGVSFTVGTSTPTITGLSPNSGAPGTAVTISGTNFGSTQGTSSVKFNGTTATPTSWSATSIVTPVPTGATTGNVVVTVGGVSSKGVTFTVTASAPSITSLSPTSGFSGTSVTITGTNFGTQGTSTVTFSGVKSAPTSWSGTSIVAPVPSAFASGKVVVTVTVNGLVSNGVNFTVIKKPCCL